MIPHILYKFATKSRPEKFRAAIENIMSLARHDSFTILVSVDHDDHSIRQTIEWLQVNRHVTGLGGNVFIIVGASKDKIDAINRDIENAPKQWKILVNMSDDMRFLVPGFDLRIIAGFAGNYDQFLHYPDQHTGQAICTMSIIGREYYDRDGYIYHPQYKSLFCDNESTEVAKIRGCYKWINERIFEHQHPCWGFGQPDEQLRKTEAFFYEDQITYNKRKLAGFPKDFVP